MEVGSTVEVPYRTKILGGVADVGDAGARALDVIWLVAALAFILPAAAVLAGWNVRMWTFAMLLMSIVLCVVGWPEARIGLVVNAVLLAALLGMPDLATARTSVRVALYTRPHVHDVAAVTGWHRRCCGFSARSLIFRRPARLFPFADIIPHCPHILRLFSRSGQGTNCAFTGGVRRLSRWCRTRGATDRELQRTMLGDTQVTLPSYEATLGVTINTAPAAI